MAPFGPAPPPESPCAEQRPGENGAGPRPEILRVERDPERSPEGHKVDDRISRLDEPGGGIVETQNPAIERGPGRGDLRPRPQDVFRREALKRFAPSHERRESRNRRPGTGGRRGRERGPFRRFGGRARTRSASRSRAPPRLRIPASSESQPPRRRPRGRPRGSSPGEGRHPPGTGPRARAEGPATSRKRKGREGFRARPSRRSARRESPRRSTARPRKESGARRAESPRSPGLRRRTETRRARKRACRKRGRRPRGSRGSPAPTAGELHASPGRRRRDSARPKTRSRGLR